MPGHKNREIADQLGCTERKVERKLNLIRLTWEQALSERGPDREANFSLSGIDTAWKCTHRRPDRPIRDPPGYPEPQMQPTNDADALPLARQIDQVCDRFESEWLGGHGSRIEEYLAFHPEPLRGPLLQALLPVELELRQRQGQPMSEEECRGRFPGFDLIVRRAFAERKGEQIRAGETDVSRESVVASRPASQSPAQPLPKALGRFEVIGVLGEGAFGTVYLARDPRLDRNVAIKVPKLDALGAGFETERFLREARTAASLRHPNICPVYEADVHEGRPYIVMAHVEGQSLDKFLKASMGPLPEQQAASITRRLALALQAAHDKEIVHRDLKPANVMLDRERNDVVVMDFGLARGPRPEDARATRSGVIMGTPAYMSPEQARGEAKSVGPATDVYSLGVMLYEMLTGRRPFNGTVTEVLGQILHVAPEPPSKVCPGVDTRLEAICVKAMAKDAAARFASMQEFAAALDAWQRTSRAPATETARAAETQEAAAVVGDAGRKARMSRRVFVLAAVLLVGSVAALGGIIFFARTPTAKVSVELTDVDLKDGTLSFFLDGRPIAPEKLAGEMELTIAKHVLVVKRGETVVKQSLLTVTGAPEPGIKAEDITPPDPRKPTGKDDRHPLPGSKVKLEAGFAPIFNGKDLTGWESEFGKEKFSVDADGNLVAAGDTPAGSRWLLTEKDYSDFVLRVDFSFVKPGLSNSGVTIRSLPGLTGANRLKLEINLRSAPIKPWTAAVVYGLTVDHAIVPKDPPALKPAGDWNTLEIEAIGPRLRVTINGQLVNEVDLSKIDRSTLSPKEKGPAEANLDRKRGRIGLESLNAPMKFRNIRVKELSR